MENYKIIKYLNQGSYGKIYLVEKKDTKNLYALKSIKIFGIDRYNKVSILNEIKILLINNSEFLLKCYDIFIHNKKLCIITEYIDGGDLDNYIKKNSLKEEELIKIFLKICVGIQALHYNNIIHRDIKPANILITKKGEIKICDFGICKFLDYNKVTNTCIGTPFFMSPEQMTNQYYDYKIDVWGIGCVLYYLLYKKYPFNAPNIHQLKNNIRYQNPFNNKPYFPFISNNNRFRMEQILKEMFEKNKQKRMNLTLFLDSSKELLQYYNINYTKNKFRHYHFKSVPHSEREWNTIIKQVYYDFKLPDSPRKNIILEKTVINEKQPEIKTYAEIKHKKYNIPPMTPLPPPQVSIVKHNHISNITPKPPSYPRPPPCRPAKIYVHPNRKNYIKTIHRIQVEKRINDRKQRIEEQQKIINKNRRELQKNSIEYHKKNVSPNIIRRHPNHNQQLANKIVYMKNRIRNVESKIKHIWAPPKK